MDSGLKYSILGPDAIAPTRHADFLDLHCPRLTVVAPRQRIEIDTGIDFQLPPETLGLVLNRRHNEQLKAITRRVNNDIGSLHVYVLNTSCETLEIQRGQVFAQMMVIPADAESDPVERERLKGLLSPEDFSELMGYLFMTSKNLFSELESFLSEFVRPKPRLITKRFSFRPQDS